MVIPRSKFVEVTIDGVDHRLFVSYWPLEKDCWLKFDVNGMFSYIAYFNIKSFWSRTKGHGQSIDKSVIVKESLELNGDTTESDVEHFFMMASLLVMTE